MAEADAIRLPLFCSAMFFLMVIFWLALLGDVFLAVATLLPAAASTSAAAPAGEGPAATAGVTDALTPPLCERALVSPDVLKGREGCVWLCM